MKWVTKKFVFWLCVIHGFLQRKMSKQRHVRFNAEKVDLTLDPKECQRSLVLSSVKKDTTVQYKSRLNTLVRFLSKWRGYPEPDPATTTRDEFMCFLMSWKTQGLGDPEETRSALLQLQRACGVDTWAASNTVVKAVLGATGPKGPDKLVLEGNMVEQYEDFIMKAPTELLGPCRNCRMALESEWGRALLVWSNRLMQELGIRLCNLLDMKESHMDYKKKELYVPRLKQLGGPGILPSSREACITFKATVRLAGGWYAPYLFPRCVQKHLNASLREAGKFFRWEPGLVHTGYCLRHTGMRQKKKRVRAELQAVAEERGVTVQTARHYSRSNVKRRKFNN